ncbi:MAG TPA: hypothetical protein VMU06_03420, partial [Stellaceae bacterium]|nr:hypothetical protein [Stellaceae bacterium]
LLSAGGSTGITTPGSITVNGPIVAGTSGQGLELLATGGGTVSLAGSVGAGTPFADVSVTAGTLRLGGSVYDTTGDQTYSTAVVLGSDVTITSSTGNLTFGGSIDGDFALSLVATAGAIGLGAPVGGTTPLGSLYIDPASINLSGTTVHTTGSQEYASAVILGSNDTLTSESGSIKFDSTVDGHFTLDVTALAGNATFLGAVGGTTALSALIVNALGFQIGAVNATNGTTLINTAPETLTGTIETTNAITFGGPITLGGNATVDTTGDGASAGANISFLGTVDGNSTLSLNSGIGTVLLSGAVGGTTPLAALIVDPGAITLGNSVHTTGSQTYMAPVVLAANVTATSDSGSVTFQSTVDGARGLSVVAGSGSAEFDGNVGAGTPLASLGVTAGGITLGAGTISTSGGQIFASPVTLTSNDTLISATGGVTFGSTVDGARALSVSASSGTAAFNGLVGNGSPLASVSASAATITLSGVATTGVQTYTGTLLLGGTYLTSGGNFTVNGPMQLTGPVRIDPGAGTLTITGSVAGTASLAILGSGADGFGSSLDLGSGTLDLSQKTTGSVTVSGPVNLGGLSTGTGGYSISFLAGGSIADPVFGNTGGVTFSGDFTFAGGLTISGETLTLAGATSVDGETNGVTLGVVNQGGNQFTVIADQISLNGAWNGTGNRIVSPSSPIGIALGGASALGDLQLGQTALAFLANGGTAPVLIGSGLSGDIVANSFQFDAPLTLLGASIAINGTLSKSAGGLVLEAVQAVNNTLTLGAIGGSVSLAGGTGPLLLQAASATLTGSTINGDPGSTNSIVGQIQFITPPQPGPGPYTVDGFDFSPNQPPPNQPPPSAPPVLVPPTNPNISNNSPGANSSPNDTTIQEINLVIQTSTGGTSQGSAQGSQGSTDTGTTGNGTLADQAGTQVGGQGGQGGSVPGDTPSSSGNAKPIVPNLFLHTNNGLGGGTGGTDGTGGTLSNPPSM